MTDNQTNKEVAEVIEERKLNQMKVAILQAERLNVNTHELGKSEMVELIRKTIITYADQTF